MKMTHLIGAVAACGLIAGAAYAQEGSMGAAPSGAVNDPAASAPGAMPSSDPASGSSGMSGSMSGAAANPATTSSTDTSTTTSNGVSATSTTAYGQDASVTTTTTTNGPVPDTAENRAKYGGPASHAGKRTSAKGN